MADLRRFPTDHPDAALLNPIIDRDNGKRGGHIWLIGDDGIIRDPVTGATISGNHHALIVRSAAGRHIRAIHSSGSGDVLLVNDDGVTISALTLPGNLTIGGNLTVDGNTQLGNSNTDTVTIKGPATLENTARVQNVFRVQNGSGGAVRLVADPQNNRLIVGQEAALSGAVADVLNVVGRSYFTPASPNDEALTIWRHAGAGSGWTLGVTADAKLAFRDTANNVRVQMGGPPNTYALDVTGWARVFGEALVTSHMGVGGNLLVSGDTTTNQLNVNDIEAADDVIVNGDLYLDNASTSGITLGSSSNGHFRVNLRLSGSWVQKRVPWYDV